MSIDVRALEEEWEEDVEPAPRPARSRRPEAREYPVGRVVGLHKGWVDVVVDGEEVAAVYGGSMRGEAVVVGDRVRVRPPRHPTDTPRIVERLARDTVLVRTADDLVAEERVVVANVDLAVAVLAAGEVETGAGLADRVLVAASAGGLDAAVCVNKVDLPGDVEELTGRYRALGYPVVGTSAVTGEGVGDLREVLAGRWSVLAGHSGVGKSSLFNLLVPGADRTVGDVGRFGGRHTTTSPRAMAVPGLATTWLVDTPGVRSFGVAHVALEDLAGHFPEFADLPCAFPGCLHDGEPGCAAPALVGDRIHPARLESYRRFLSALRGESP